jgi:hypothetical protein
MSAKPASIAPAPEPVFPLLAALDRIEPSPEALANAAAMGGDLRPLLQLARGHLQDAHRLIRQLSLLVALDSDEYVALAGILRKLA